MGVGGVLVTGRCVPGGGARGSGGPGNGFIELVAGAEDGGGGEAALGGSGVRGDDDVGEGFESVGADEGGEEGALAVGHGFEALALFDDLLTVEPVVELIDGEASVEGEVGEVAAVVDVLAEEGVLGFGGLPLGRKLGEGAEEHLGEGAVGCGGWGGVGFNLGLGVGGVGVGVGSSIRPVRGVIGGIGRGRGVGGTGLET